jgi:antitoxin component HigA of HigAB toxin-antitoxin module
MHLIAKNKISNYIQQHPEAETNFLVWLKEFPYREGKSLFKHIKELPAQWNITGEIQFGNNHYKIRYRANLCLKTAYVEWVGTVAEFGVYMENELKNLQILYPDLKVEHKTTHVVLTPPDFDELVKRRAFESLATTTDDEVYATNVISDQPVDFLFKTTKEYENALANVVRMFGAGPATAEFAELAVLVPRLTHYEDRHIQFRKLDPLDVIKLKMKEWDMGTQYPLDLIRLIGSKEDLDRFLSGEKPLSKQALDNLYKYLKINFM